MNFRYFEKKNWLSLIVAWFFGFVLLIHGIVGVLSLNSQKLLFALDLLGNISEIIIGVVLILLGIFQSDAIDSLENVGEEIVKYI